MSRAKTIQREFEHSETEIQNNERVYLLTVRACIARAYDSGFIEGSGQSSITALERDVVVAALEWADNDGPIESYSRLREASRALKDALEREATE
jgi:hypothetical protein